MMGSDSWPHLIKACVYQEPSSIYTSAVCSVIVLVLVIVGILDVNGVHLFRYSKFWKVGSAPKSPTYIVLPSRIGMLIVYTPALLSGITSFVLFAGGDTRFKLLKSVITIHFLKRNLEVLFIHKYSAYMALDFVIIGFFAYLAVAAGMVYYQHETQGFPEPLLDLKYIGVFMVLLGMLGNFYHHCLLSKLRQMGDKAYKIPRGGLFGIVVCPHYLFEILTFIGISFISQTLFSFSFTVGSALCLVGKSYATRKWYLSKFGNFPKNVKALIPYVL